MELQFSKSQDGLIPAIIQDAETSVVLMLGYMNKEAYEKTLTEKKVTFYSRSRQTLWTKGETSGNFLDVVEILIDCDQDTLLIKAKPHGPTCHTGSDTCFDEINTSNTDFLSYLEQVIKTRKEQPVEGSYTNHLFNKGVNKIAQKVGEEAVELIIEAKDSNKDLFLGEAGDLMYHYLVLLVHKGYSLEEVISVLKSRHS
ncbi:MAG: bifunctional phosphoribosyl-AMP cyclohydrolase/phosphoribosyl-ATP diphosphatase HisIE [Bacteroidales bacterium]